MLLMLRPMTMPPRCSPAAVTCAMYGVFLGFAALGCSAASDDSTTGNLGVASFSYQCVSTSDAACGGKSYSTTASPASFPQAFAVGSRIGISIDTAGINEGNPVLQPVSTEFLTPSLASANTFTIVKAGFGGIYATSTTDSTFVDYTLLRLVDVASLSLGDSMQTKLTTPAPLSTDDDLTLTVLPESDGVVLAGTLDFEWTLGDPTVLAFTTANPTARTTVHALKSGMSTLMVTLGSVHASTTITVL